MIVIEADVLGYCMGVRRAVDLAVETAQRVRERPIYTIGPLIHNRHALETLADLGITAIDPAELPESLAGKTVIIRAHGIPPGLREELERRGAALVDAACPHVVLSQRKARAASEAGRQVVLVGDREHGEIVGIAGYAPGCSVVGSAAEARALNLREGAVIIAQTTLNAEEYEEIRAEFRSQARDLEIVDSICGATSGRQDALKRLCASVDAVLVIGGRNSANAARLLATALKSGKKAWLVEDETEIPEEAFGFGIVGLSAGASTPDRVIAAVRETLKSGRRERERDRLPPRG